MQLCRQWQIVYMAMPSSDESVSYALCISYPAGVVESILHLCGAKRSEDMAQPPLAAQGKLAYSFFFSYSNLCRNLRSTGSGGLDFSGRLQLGLRNVRGDHTCICFVICDLSPVLLMQGWAFRLWYRPAYVCILTFITICMPL